MFTLALEAALAGWPEIISERAQPHQLEQLAAAIDPAQVAILYEQNRLSPRLLRQLDQGGFALVSLDAATGMGTHANGRRLVITNVQDLLQLIQQ